MSTIKPVESIDYWAAIAERRISKRGIKTDCTLKRIPQLDSEKRTNINVHCFYNRKPCYQDILGNADLRVLAFKDKDMDAI